MLLVIKIVTIKNSTYFLLSYFFKMVTSTGFGPEKFKTACIALRDASGVFKDIDNDLYNTFYDAYAVISDVIGDLIDLIDRADNS